MNARSVLWAFAVIACVAAGVVLSRQRAELHSLRAESQARLLADTHRIDASDPAPSAPAVKAKAKASTGSSNAPVLTPTERLELMALRRRATELSEQRRQLARLSDENAVLRNRLVMASNVAASRFPPDWTARAAARQAGLATPEAAFESFVWALEHKDMNYLLQVVAPEFGELMRRNLASSGHEEFWRMREGLAGFRIVEARIQAPDTATVRFEIMPGEAGPEMSLRLIDGAWRVRP
jgi:hypothetical protein